ncbi:hypothetical protein L6164_002047 [Bauhinia variegata]|uniref:Uncharacterized protein n=1 Tax=Bauhinia variegata TaxID=167791 RepID=A0ACB9PZ39_BAUVA|nr:hypothetical protein L6164_002047 [Bauhinia variegata]
MLHLYVMPLLCFGGDTVPIRAVSWAPFEGDPESSNIILTAGHGGLKFWDLRKEGCLHLGTSLSIFFSTKTVNV